MGYKAELIFLRRIFEKCHLQTQLLNPEKPLGEQAVWKGQLPWDDEGYAECTVYDLLPKMQPATLYRTKDAFLCSYMFLLLPEGEQCLLLIGPYLTTDLTQLQVAERAKLLGMDSHRVSDLAKYYGGMPVLAENSQLFVMLDVFGEYIWGGSEPFTVVNIEQEGLGAISPLLGEGRTVKPELAVRNMQMLEQRYAYENELMHAVTKGQLHKAERLFSGVSMLLFEQRVKDPVRNLKNYSIVMNTLLRKAAENGGVHPIYLNSVSSDFAGKIEGISTTDDVLPLMKEMFRTYCRLVRKHSIRQYSPPVQKAITYIDSDLTQDLSLRALAAVQNVSAGYLSALFKQETGQTLTEYVNRKRVKHAMLLLKTTQLQIQTIAQDCGIVDVHYFSKLFKRYVGKTPKEYRGHPD